MRVTKAMLECEIKAAYRSNALLAREVKSYKTEAKILREFMHGTTALTIALERSTDAVAHIIADLSKRR